MEVLCVKYQEGYVVENIIELIKVSWVSLTIRKFVLGTRKFI